mgnify:CR=1 FL=1
MNLFDASVRHISIDRSNESKQFSEKSVGTTCVRAIYRECFVCTLLLIFSGIEVSLSHCSQHCHVRSSSSRRTKSLLESLYRVKYTPPLKSDRRPRMNRTRAKAKPFDKHHVSASFRVVR